MPRGDTRARVRVGGRQRGFSEEAERTAIIAETLYREQQLGINEIAQRLHISKVTLYKVLTLPQSDYPRAPQTSTRQLARLTFARRTPF